MERAGCTEIIAKDDKEHNKAQYIIKTLDKM